MCCECLCLLGLGTTFFHPDHGKKRFCRAGSPNCSGTAGQAPPALSGFNCSLSFFSLPTRRRGCHLRDTRAKIPPHKTAPIGQFPLKCSPLHDTARGVLVDMHAAISRNADRWTGDKPPSRVFILYLTCQQYCCGLYIAAFNV